MPEIARPQSLATFPMPAGLLLVDGRDPEADAVRGALSSGRLPTRWPKRLRGLELAHAGRVSEAWAALDGDDPVTRFNRFVLRPEGVDADLIREDLPAPVRALVDVVRFTLGVTDDVPQLGDADGEVAAVVMASQASAALAHGDAAQAVDLLHAAAAACPPDAAPLAGLLSGNAGSIAHENGLDPARARADLEAGIAALEGTDLAVARAELHLQLAQLLHEAAASGGSLNPAVHHYYCVLQLVTEASAPQLWAAAQLGLGTAYLTMPMTQASDSLRTAVAMQALRAALRVFTRESHPAHWSSATLNLANALVYSPSAKHGDNLIEAVELYEEVLSARERNSDPVGRARVLANQGNALAHLGIFDLAKAKLYEARFLFEEQLDHDAVLAVRSVLDEIARQTIPKDEPAPAATAGGVS